MNILVDTFRQIFRIHLRLSFDQMHNKEERNINQEIYCHATWEEFASHPYCSIDKPDGVFMYKQISPCWKLYFLVFPLVPDIAPVAHGSLEDKEAWTFEHQIRSQSEAQVASKTNRIIYLGNIDHNMSFSN